MNDISKDSPLERYMTILETIAPFPDGLTAVELETALDLPKTTVNRLLNVLISSGMVNSQNSRNRSFRLGERIFRLIQASPDTNWLALLAQRPLQILAEQTGQSAFISRFDGKEVRSVTCVAPDTPVRTYVMPGMLLPINATASAKAILAFQSKDVQKRMLEQELQSYTDNTKTTAQSLLEELDKIRIRGFALDLAEHVSGLGSIAFPIRTGRTEVINAVGVTGPYGMIIDKDFDTHCTAIEATSRKLAKLLQMRGAPMEEAALEG
ncbi:IclR family transcriptional regulator [Phyllobacterium sp. SL163]|uniref:IclR family transcriptional regulator n=1 Tax=unclassified Phyllobacterium TaxID=2638441 RepID=UPI001AD2FF6B|nr:IclR family transcriptional regulator [Phyllobacterium sp.]